MAKSISGNLRDLKLVDLLVLLCTKKEQWGKLVFSNKEEKSEIYIDRGKIVHATFQKMEGFDALFSLLTWSEGDFEFEINIKSDKTTINMNTKELLTECLNKRKELAVIQEVITSPDEVFKLSGRSTSGRISMTTEDLSIISYLDGTKSIKKIEEISGKNRFVLYKTLYRFLSFDVIIKVDQEKVEVIEKVKEEVKKEPPVTDGPTINLEIIEKIERALKEFMGPSGKIMLESCIDWLGYKRESFPLSKLEDLIQILARESKLDIARIRKIITETTGEITSQNKASVGGEFFDTLEKRLKTIIGPSAGITLETCVESMGHNKSDFPISRLNSLIESFIKETGINKKDIQDILDNIKKIQENYGTPYPTRTLPEKEKGGIFSFFKRGK